jgi:hypothetical protein
MPIALLLAVELETQDADDVKIQDITSPLLNEDEPKVAAFVPALKPFTLH